jgi:uroporphyrinogen-III synthase
MVVWITRSQPGAARQAAVLRAHGHQALVVPVLTISRMPGPAQSGSFTDIVFLSEHAVTFGADRLAEDLDFSSVRVFAVGSNTASRLAEFGVSAAIPAVANSEGLLAMPEFASVSGKAVLIIAGDGGRDVLAAGLQARGARVEKLSVYRRQAIDQVDYDLSHVDAVAVSSGDGFEFMARLWFAADGRRDVPVFVPSERVAAIGRRLGFSRVHTCAGAGADALLDGLTNFTAHG